ncbi:TPA: ATP-binding protein [Pseudomonas aeruginosa]
MSLRVRLSLILGATFLLLWSLTAAWMLCDLRRQLSHTLDERLAASTRMVAGLLQQLPQPLSNGAVERRLATTQGGIPDGLACQVASLKGEVIAQSHVAPDKFLGAQGTGFHVQTLDGLEWRSFTLQVGDIRVSAADRLDEREQLNSSIVLSAAVPASFALVGSLVLFWLGICQGLRPLRRIRDSLADRNADSLEPLSLEKLPAELKPLVVSQNQLFLRIAQAIERERRLTGDAAHELRSPLTAIKTHLQVARITQGDVASQAIAFAEQGADRLQRTLDQLLLLARVEGSLSFDDGTDCTALEVVEHAVEDASGRQAEQVLIRNLNVSEEVQLAAPSLLIVTALRNLLENALRHTTPGTQVELDLERRGDCLHLSVRDHGPGMDPELLPRMTERFWHKNGNGGSGLGLAIVQAIVLRCRGTLDFQNLEGGLCATLQVPLRC